MKTFNNVTNIKLNVFLAGQGIFNYGGDDDLNRVKKYLKKDEHRGDNIRVGKHVFYPVTYKVKEGEKSKEYTGEGFRHIISYFCLRNLIYRKQIPSADTMLSYRPTLMYECITQPAYISRGYVFTDKITINKDSILSICDAEENDYTYDEKTKTVIPKDATPHTSLNLTIGSKSGIRDKRLVKTSLFYYETVGQIKYVANGNIDLTEAQFIPADILYDRDAVGIALGADDNGLYIQALNRNLGKSYQYGDYYISSHITTDEISERGILLDKDDVNKIVKLTLANILDVDAYKVGATLKVEAVKLTICMADGETETIVLSSSKELDDYEFNYYTKYLPASDKKILSNQAMYKKIMEEKKKAKAAAKKKGKEAETEETAE